MFRMSAANPNAQRKAKQETKMKLFPPAVVLALTLVVKVTTGFTPTSRIVHSRNIPLWASPDDTVANPFDIYSVRDPLQQLASKDDMIGSGAAAEIGNVVTVAYTGRLMSTGKMFDSGTGFSFRLGDGKVLPGWEIGLQGMKVGGKRTLRIPPSLAYGDRGAKDVIPPGAHLEFDCELKSIATNQIEETLSQFNVQKERIITFGLLVILLAVRLPCTVHETISVVCFVFFS
jgi:peptidylprolyl isomerase